MTQRRYRLGPREVRGTVAGWRAGQVVVVVSALAVAAMVFMVSIGILAILLSIAIVSFGIGCAVVPVRGRSVEEWIPVLLHHVRCRHRTHRFEARILTGVDGAGLLVDRRVVVVLELVSDGFALREGSDRDRLVEGFSASIGQLARTAGIVERAGWSVGRAPGSIDLLEQDRRRRARGPIEQVQAYARLLAEFDDRLPEHRTHLFLATGILRDAPEVALEILLKEATTMAGALEAVGYPRPMICEESELRRLLEEAGAKESPPRNFVSEAAHRFDRIEGPHGCSRSWWVAEWPRHEVSAESLSSLLLGDGQRRMTVVVEPVDATVALRRAQVASTKGAADEELRRQGGFLADRRRRAEADHRDGREEELVAGHQGLRFSGFLSVTGDDSTGLEEQARVTELLATQVGLRLRLLQGDHHRGHLASFPFARGLS